MLPHSHAVCIINEHNATIIFFIVASAPVVPMCYNGQVRIGYNITNSYSNYEEISGGLEICVDGAYQQVCGSSAANLNASTLVQQACNDIGYRGTLHVYCCCHRLLLVFFL